MKLHVLFLLRKGEDTPEAVAVADEESDAVNPGYLREESDRYARQSDILARKIFVVDLGPGAVNILRKRLAGIPPTLKASLEDECLP